MGITLTEFDDLEIHDVIKFEDNGQLVVVGVDKDHKVKVEVMWPLDKRGPEELTWNYEENRVQASTEYFTGILNTESTYKVPETVFSLAKKWFLANKITLRDLDDLIELLEEV